MKLAVLIPAYKSAFFGKSLASLAAQTDRDFRVYVGDDASPENLRPIVDSFRGQLDLRYTRFETNLGGRDLVGQWTRCMGLLGDEDWVWFFSDDDLAAPGCVAALRALQARTTGEVYRFNTSTIDEHDYEFGPTVGGPDFESATAMAYHLLRGERGNSWPDHVFSRAVYARTGGFVSTPYAQGADWATSIRFAQASGMHIVQDGLVRWRLAGESVSANAARKRGKTVRGHYAFIAWLLAHFQFLRARPEAGITYEAMAEAARDNLRRIIVTHYRGIPAAMYWQHVRFLRAHFGDSTSAAIGHLGSILRYRLRAHKHAWQDRLRQDRRASEVARAAKRAEG
jgi:glycosyltransferase involved in cell wall biosynthesis